MSLIIHSKYKYFDSTVQKDEDRQQKFHFCCLPFAVNVMLNLSIIRSEIIRVISESNERAARVRFEITSMISDQNCAIRSSIATLLDPF